MTGTRKFNELDRTFNNFVDERLTVLKGEEIRQVNTLNGKMYSDTREIEYFDTDLETKFQILEGVDILIKLFSKEEIIEAIKKSNLPFSEMTTFDKMPEKMFNFDDLSLFPYRKERVEKWEGTGQYRKLIHYNLIHYLHSTTVNMCVIYQTLIENKYNFDGLTMSNYSFYGERENPTLFYVDSTMEYTLNNGEVNSISLSFKVDDLIKKDYASFLKSNLDYIKSYYTNYRGFEYNEKTICKHMDDMKIKERFFS